MTAASDRRAPERHVRWSGVAHFARCPIFVRKEPHMNSLRAVTRLVPLALAIALSAPVAGAGDHAFDIQALSSKPYLVSGGDALIRVDVPAAVSLAAVKVTLN